MAHATTQHALEGPGVQFGAAVSTTSSGPRAPPCASRNWYVEPGFSSSTVHSAAAATLFAALHSSGYSLYSTVTPSPPAVLIVTLVSVQDTYSGLERSAIDDQCELLVVFIDLYSLVKGWLLALAHTHTLALSPYRPHKATNTVTRGHAWPTQKPSARRTALPVGLQLNASCDAHSLHC